MNTRLLAASALVTATLLAGCASTSPGYSSSSGYGYGNPGATRCMDCGTVVAIEQVGKQGSNIAGPVLGGIVGAVAAKELARRNTDSEGRRNVAIAAGAAGGAVAGNAIQNRSSGHGYDVHVRLDDGRTVVLQQNSLNGIRQGSYVQIRNGEAHLR
jgi:outer membrane lipoprotein SlyB